MTAYTLDQIRNELDQQIDRFPSPPPLSKGRHGAIVGILNTICKSTQARYEVLMWCFPGKWPSLRDVSTKDLTDDEWFALNSWVNPHKVGKSWVGRPGLEQEVGEVWMDYKLHREKNGTDDR